MEKFMSLSSGAFKHMVEQMPINVLVCDAKNLIITYANRKSRETLNAISALLPKGVNGGNIVGQCIDVFHKNPSHQRNLLGNKSNLPHSAIIRLGQEFLDLQIMEVPGGFGGGSLMLTWTVVTAAERLKRMVDKCPLNIMMCDPETFVITYMNETSLNTLRSIENLLPVKADKVVGSCIDIFHKHPEHQRKMLADPKNLPHRAKIRLGTEWLELNVAAIVDNQGSYLGPMVSWSVITTQVKVAEAVKEIAGSVAAASTELHHNSDQIGALVRKTSDQSTSASSAAVETSANVQSVASAAEEMNASVQEIATNMTKSKSAVENAVSQAATADQSARNLESAAKAMSNIVDLIQAIASQINLLALNATIESARAGEAGKGFAVVANEVKSLAGQTTKATTEIAKEIQNMQSISQEVISALDLIKTSVQEVNQYVTGVATAVEEQTAVTREISSNMQTASTGVSEVTHGVSDIAEAAKQTDAATKEVLAAARELSQQAERLNKEIAVLLK
jgi:methyl-accepting chemotaxis protein